MPKREDERHLSLSGKHPAYCTCTECTSKFLRRRRSNPADRLKQKFFKREKVKRHPTGCNCSTCTLLRSVGTLNDQSKSRGNFLKRLLRRF